MGEEQLRVALLAYRGNPHCGGQGVYVRHLSRELAALGHHVEVLSGPPYPDLDPAVRLVELPSLDFYRADDPLRKTVFLDIRGPVDLLEYLMLCTAAFPEPLTFSIRAWRHLRGRVGDFDIVHDNQCLAYGLLGIERVLHDRQAAARADRRQAVGAVVVGAGQQDADQAGTVGVRVGHEPDGRPRAGPLDDAARERDDRDLLGRPDVEDARLLS